MFRFVMSREDEKGEKHAATHYRGHIRSLHPRRREAKTCRNFPIRLEFVSNCLEHSSSHFAEAQWTIHMKTESNYQNWNWTKQDELNWQARRITPSQKEGLVVYEGVTMVYKKS
jgi:hypothetical protein